jgi:hypothetical protein
MNEQNNNEVAIIENAEFGSRPTPQMEAAYAAHIKRFGDVPVGYRDNFFHGYLACMRDMASETPDS